jgi:hypothetical protein
LPTPLQCVQRHGPEKIPRRAASRHAFAGGGNQGRTAHLGRRTSGGSALHRVHGRKRSRLRRNARWRNRHHASEYSPPGRPHDGAGRRLVSRFGWRVPLLRVPGRRFRRLCRWRGAPHSAHRRQVGWRLLLCKERERVVRRVSEEPGTLDCRR